MKRLIAVIIAITLLIGNMAIVFADDADRSSLVQKKIMVYLKPDVSIELEGVKQIFYNADGKIVYPIIYNGSTYLPIRSVSGLMGEPVEWDNASKTIFIGKTLTDPNKTDLQAFDKPLERNENQNIRSLKAELVNAYLKPDVLVMYDFILQNFCDVNGNSVYPIIYNGTSYLPIRAVSDLMKRSVEWDGAAKTIRIGAGDETKPDNTSEEVREISEAGKILKIAFDREEILYYEATAKTTSLKEAVTLDEKLLIAKTISENYNSAQKLTADIKILDTSDYSAEEVAAYEKLVAFAESTEYYVLVLENIAYLAAQDADYSMLAETFLYFAMDSQDKMEEARGTLQELEE